MIEQSRRVGYAPGVIAAARYRAGLLWADVLVGSPDLARLGLVVLALCVQTAVYESPGHFRPAPSPLGGVFVSIATLASLALALAAGLPQVRTLLLRPRQILCMAALVGIGLLCLPGAFWAGQGIRYVATNTPYGNDGAVLDLYAATQLRHGHNPYLQTNIVPALAAINAPATTTTPLMRGQFAGARAYPSPAAIQGAFDNVLRYRPHTIPPEFESQYNYPSGSFLFILPFIWFGAHDVRWLYGLAVVLMGAWFWRHLPRATRPLAFPLMLASVPLVALTAGGQPDPIYGVFLLAGYAGWRSRWTSPLAFGMAVAIKQIAWFFLPFYMILVARELGWREAIRRGGIITAVFFLLNGPFILWSPSAYISSLAGPMSDPMFPLGIGLVAMFVAGALPMVPKLVFTTLETLAWIGGAVSDLKWRLPVTAGPVLAALPLFFAYRSLVNYFYLVPLLALGMLLTERQASQT